MITFATLLLGLVVGTTTVEVLADPAVARVELLLDEAMVARIARPPWRAEVDFGRELRPHELLARAYDQDGDLLATDRQRINVPRPPAVAEIFLEEKREGGRLARVRWESVTAAEPTTFTVELDGRPLSVTDPRSFPLPALDPDALHFLRVELAFEDAVDARAELTFGGTFGSSTSSELTAVPITLENRHREPGPEELAGYFLYRGEPVPVVAVEKGAADLVVVRDPSFETSLRKLVDGYRLPERRIPRFFRGVPEASEPLRYQMPLRRDHRLRFLWPRAHRDPREGYHLRTFPHTGVLDVMEAGFLWYLLNVREPPADRTSPPRLADAVAAAGLEAARRGRRRAVVLILGDSPADDSQFSPQEVRSFLASLRVDLRVWAVEPSTAAGWGEVEEVGSFSRLERAVRELTRSLDRQRVVWLEGLCLPDRIEVADGAWGEASGS